MLQTLTIGIELQIEEADTWPTLFAGLPDALILRRFDLGESRS